MLASLSGLSAVAAITAGAVAVVGFLFAVARGVVRWRRRPKLRIVYEDTPEYQHRIVAEEIHHDAAADAKAKVEKVYALLLKIEETRGGFAHNVFMRMLATEPPPPPGGRALPYPLAILRPGRPIAVDIPPHGIEYALLEEKIFLQGGKWTVIGPTNHWLDHKKIAFTVELFAGDKLTARKSFGIARNDGRNSYPELVEL